MSTVSTVTSYIWGYSLQPSDLCVGSLNKISGPPDSIFPHPPRYSLPYHGAETSSPHFLNYPLWWVLVQVFWFSYCNLGVIPLSVLLGICSRWVFCYLEPSMLRGSGTPISVMNIFNSIPESIFLAMGCISENEFPLDNNWEYLFLSKYFFHPSIVLDFHIPSNRLCCYIMTARYIFDNGITTNHSSCCVILRSVYFASSIPIWHLSLISPGHTDKWFPLDCNFFSGGTSLNSIPVWDTFIGIDRTFNLSINICDRVPISYRDWFSGLLWYFSTESKASPWVFTAPTVLEI